MLNQEVVPIREWTLSPLQIAWCEALESGDYRQTTGRLWHYYTDNPTQILPNFDNPMEFCNDRRSQFCCLGVCAVVADKAKVDGAARFLAALDDGSVSPHGQVMSHHTDLGSSLDPVTSALNLQTGSGNLFLNRITQDECDAMKGECSKIWEYLVAGMPLDIVQGSVSCLAEVNDNAEASFGEIAYFVRRFPHLVFKNTYKEESTC